MGGTVDRDLMARDLEALAGMVAPAIESRLGILRSVPIVGPSLIGLLRDSPRQLTSRAFASVLSLPDEDIAALADLVARELGAWRGLMPPATGAEIDAARPAAGRLAEALA